MQLKTLISLTLVMLVLCVGKAYSQLDTASLLGRVTDATGAVVPGASVTATNVDTNVSISRITNKDGEYNIPALAAGTYDVTAKMNGFTNAVTNGIHLEVGTNQRVDVKMQAGSTEQITVNENALELETDTSQKQQVITGDQIEAFPLRTMDYTDMLTLSSGVTQDPAGQDLGTSSVVREGSYNINGMRSTYNNYLLDGLDNNAHGTSNLGFSNEVIIPSQYNISQFSIVTTLPPAEFGRSAAGTINVIFKSGTNALHGLVFEGLENTLMDANGYFVAYSPSGAVEKTTLNRNQFGGNLGGPFLREKFFYFVDYEGLRESRNIANELDVPDAADHQLIISPNATANTTTVLDPFTDATYAADRPLPRSILSPIALEILDAMPLPNNNGAGANSQADDYSVLQRFANSYDKEDARLDAQLSPRMSGFVRVSQSKEHDYDQPTLPLPLGGGNGYYLTINQQVALGFTRQIRATQLLEARLGASYTKASIEPLTLGDPRTFGIPGLPTAPQIWGGLTTITIDGYSTLGRSATNPQWEDPFFVNPKVSYSYLVGHHNFKAGYEFSYMRQIVQDVSPIYGEMHHASGFSGYSFADFLFGASSELDLTSFFVAHLRQGGHSGFFQDDWKILPNVTLNLGLRYEYASHFYEKDHQLTDFDPVITPATGQLIRAWASGSAYQRQLIDPDLNDFMPRIGFAISPNRNLVVHGGYGIGYLHYTRSGQDDDLAVNAPQVNQVVYNQVPPYFKGQPAGTKSSPTFYTLDQGYPQGMADPANFNLFTSNVKYIPRNYRDPYVQSWYLGFQSRITKTALFDAAYVGNHALKLQEVGDYNQRNPALGVDPVTGYFQRPNSAIGDVLETYNGGFSNYNGLQARFQEQGFHGLWLLNAFTWSRDFGNVADPLTATHGFSGSPQDFYNQHGNGSYGPSQYDTPIINNTAMIWTLPVGRNKLLFRHAGNKLDNIVGGWQVSAYNQYHSGVALTPNFTATGSEELSNDGGVQYRPYFAVATANTATNPNNDPNGLPLGASLRSYAIKRLHIPHHPEEAFCNDTYDNIDEASYNGCTLGFATTNPNAVPAPTSDTANWSGTSADPRGNVPNGLLRADSFDEVDVGVNKKFALPWYNSFFELRVQFYNVLNKTNFTTPGMTCCTSEFGRITSTYGPGRIGQIQTRLWF